MYPKEEANVIKTILSEFYEEVFIEYQEKNNIIVYPGGTFTRNEVWELSFDYSYTIDPHDLIIVAIISKVLTEEGIPFELFEGYYTIADANGIVIDLLWDSEIIRYSIQNYLEYNEAVKLLTEEKIHKNKNKKLH